MIDEERNYAWKRAKVASKLLNIDIYNHIKQVHSGVWQVGSKVDGDMRNRAYLAGLKGILHQKIFFRLNLIFWIVMGWGIARFGRRSLKTTET